MVKFGYSGAKIEDFEEKQFLRKKREGAQNPVTIVHFFGVFLLHVEQAVAAIDTDTLVEEF